PAFAASLMKSLMSSTEYPHGLQSRQILITLAPNSRFSRTALTISSRLFASRYSGYTMLWYLYISGDGVNCPPVVLMIKPEGMIVGPGIHPCSIACRSAVSAYRPLLPTSHTTVNPELRSCSALDAAWIERSGVGSAM